MSQLITPPDFVLIPRQLLVDESLQPLDRTIFGYIYWFTKLKNERCTAGNKVLAELARTSSTSVRNSLTRLERSGYIAKIYADDTKKIRLEIVCLLSFGVNVASPSANVASPSATPQQIEVASVDAQKKNRKRKVKESSVAARDTTVSKQVAVDTFKAMTAAVNCSAKPEGNDFIVGVIAALHRRGYNQQDVVQAATYVNNPVTQDKWMKENLKIPSKVLAYIFFTNSRKHDVDKSVESVAHWIAVAQEWNMKQTHASNAQVASDGRPIIRRVFGGNNE